MAYRKNHRSAHMFTRFDDCLREDPEAVNYFLREKERCKKNSARSVGAPTCF